ncbi:hypothetical protein BELL_1672g00010 [Botrytis elliptica]|uniref:Uncharacterized protein n=1 Tax=Botrytis elliptica TaxID=278938 RepID=A0A4Z1HYE3_9HELO|nr:hypothetical protein EAE99_004171 [Botrytis elliptica]TGO52262.1 hypothetical protein BELL_1672g00010 [Botrytis elliptica]
MSQQPVSDSYCSKCGRNDPANHTRRCQLRDDDGIGSAYLVGATRDMILGAKVSTAIALDAVDGRATRSLQLGI